MEREQLERQAPWAKPSEDELTHKANAFFQRAQDHFDRWKNHGRDIKDLKAAVGLYHWALKWWDLDSCRPLFVADAAGAAAQAHLCLWESDNSQIASLKKAVALYDRAVAAYGEHMPASVLLRAARSHFHLWEQDKSKIDHLKACLPLYDRALDKYGERIPPAEVVNAAWMHLSLFLNDATQQTHLQRAHTLYTQAIERFEQDAPPEVLSNTATCWIQLWKHNNIENQQKIDQLRTAAHLLDRALDKYDAQTEAQTPVSVLRGAALSHFTLWRLHDFPIETVRKAANLYDRLLELQGNAAETLDLYHAMICHFDLWLHEKSDLPTSEKETHSKSAYAIFDKILTRNGVHINPEAPEYLRNVHNAMNYISMW